MVFCSNRSRVSDELLSTVRQVLTDNQRKRDTARMQALRPLFNVTETLFSETDRDRLLDLIVNAIRDHLHCSNAAYYQVENGTVSTVAQRGRVLQVDGEILPRSSSAAWMRMGIRS
jgi:transcriptional regulator with GAF, ATPase, and Fis domain